MTSGTSSFGPSPTGTVAPNTRSFNKTWSGGDGRTETAAGSNRSKWNNYTATIISRSVGAQYEVRGRYLSSPSDTTWSSFNQGSGFSPMGSWPQLSDFNANDELRLQSKLLEKVKGHQFNLAVFAGEGKKTIDMVCGTIGTLTRAFLALKHGDFTTAARQLGASPKGRRPLTTKDVGSRWLELQYGWKPLIGDCYEAAKAYENITAAPRRTSVRTSIQKDREVLVSGGSAGSFYRANGKLLRRKSIRYELTENLSAARQLGLLNPWSVAWELLPYSFVLDWFVPIGTYLDNYAQIPKLKGRFMTSTLYGGEGLDFSEKNPTSVGFNGDEIIEYQSMPSISYVERRVTRTVSTSLTPPLPTFNIRGLEAGSRVWNALALARVAFKS